MSISCGQIDSSHGARALLGLVGRHASGPANQTLGKPLAVRMIEPPARNDSAAGVVKAHIAEFVVDIHAGTRYTMNLSFSCDFLSL